MERRHGQSGIGGKVVHLDGARSVVGRRRRWQVGIGRMRVVRVGGFDLHHDVAAETVVGGRGVSIEAQGVPSVHRRDTGVVNVKGRGGGMVQGEHVDGIIGVGRRGLGTVVGR